MTTRRFPIQITALSPTHFLIDGESYFTRDEYLKRIGLSQKSVQVPYAHVEDGIADCVEIGKMKLFTPLKRTTVR